MNEKFDVTGMTCSACSSRVEKCVSKLEGVEEVSVNLLTNSMQVKYKEGEIDENAIISAVEKAGYGANLHQGAQPKKASVKVDAVEDAMHSMRYRLIVSFIFLIPLFYISMGHMMGLPIPSFLSDMENAIAYAFTQFLLCLPILYVNRKYYQVGFKTLFHGAPNMDSLIAIGSAAAMIYGIVAIYGIGYGLGVHDMALVERFHMDLYFESAATILTLITLGKYLEAKSKGKTSEAISKLMDLAPQTALVWRDGQEREIAVEEVVIGDTVIVKPGTKVPVDGVILEGSTALDEAAITGESIPVEKGVGDSVVGATMNKSGSIRFRATRVGNDTTLAKIIQLVEDASASKAPIAKLADKIAGIFVPVVILIAIAASAYWLIQGQSIEFALSIGISVLVISCPCALGLATPVAIMVGTGKGAENGILIKSGEALETAHAIQCVVMDKTGTITEGKPQVTDVITLNASRNELLELALALEKPSEHPLAEAIVAYSEKAGFSAASVEHFKAVFGKGVEADFNGRHYLAGNQRMMNEAGIDCSDLLNQLDQLADQGKTPLLFADTKQVLGILAVADVVKPTSREAIQRFQKQGIDVVMLTGDNKRTAEAIRSQLNINTVIAEVLPQDKEKVISDLQAKGQKVAMIGDGINDAPALARADVGIAIGAGTDVAIESADIVLMRSDLLDAVTALRLSKAVIRNIKENLFWAFFYNSVGIPLAAGLFYTAFNLKLNPMFGAAAMSLSSVCVVSNALRLKFFKTDHTAAELKPADENKQQGENKMKTIKIEGMMCMHCVNHVEKALNGIEGVHAKVDLEKQQAVVTLDHEVSDETLKAAVAEAGYEVVSID